MVWVLLVDNNIVLVRNHEIVPQHGMKVGPFKNVNEQIALRINIMTKGYWWNH